MKTVLFSFLPLLVFLFNEMNNFNHNNFSISLLDLEVNINVRISTNGCPFNVPTSRARLLFLSLTRISPCVLV